jgi:hypothetical protein
MKLLHEFTGVFVGQLSVPDGRMTSAPSKASAYMPSQVISPKARTIDDNH